jgi:hypothetical protein
MHSQIHKSVHSNYIGYVLLALMYNNQRPKKNGHCLLMALTYYNEKTKPTSRLEASRRTRNKEEPMTNEKAMNVK